MITDIIYNLMVETYVVMIEPNIALYGYDYIYH